MFKLYLSDPDDSVLSVIGVYDTPELASQALFSYAKKRIAEIMDAHKNDMFSNDMLDEIKESTYLRFDRSDEKGDLVYGYPSKMLVYQDFDMYYREYLMFYLYESTKDGSQVIKRLYYLVKSGEFSKRLLTMEDIFRLASHDYEIGLISSTDRDWLIKEYELTEEEADELCDHLSKIERIDSVLL